jgi:hypothetical protein
VLSGDDVALIARKPEAAIRAVVEICRVFPSARVIK